MIINSVKRKTILQGKGVTQTRLAKELRLSRDQIKHVLNLQRFTPHIQESIARYFGQSVEELFGKWAWTRQVIKRGRRLRVQKQGVGNRGQGKKGLKVQGFKGRNGNG